MVEFGWCNGIYGLSLALLSELMDNVASVEFGFVVLFFLLFKNAVGGDSFVVGPDIYHPRNILVKKVFTMSYPASSVPFGEPLATR